MMNGISCREYMRVVIILDALRHLYSLADNCRRCWSKLVIPRWRSYREHTINSNVFVKPSWSISSTFRAIWLAKRPNGHGDRSDSSEDPEATNPTGLIKTLLVLVVMRVLGCIFSPASVQEWWFVLSSWQYKIWRIRAVQNFSSLLPKTSLRRHFKGLLPQKKRVSWVQISVLLPTQLYSSSR